MLGEPGREKVVGSDARKRRSACRGGLSLCKSCFGITSLKAKTNYENGCGRGV